MRPSLPASPAPQVTSQRPGHGPRGEGRAGQGRRDKESPGRKQDVDKKREVELDEKGRKWVQGYVKGTIGRVNDEKGREWALWYGKGATGVFHQQKCASNT